MSGQSSWASKTEITPMKVTNEKSGSKEIVIVWSLFQKQYLCNNALDYISVALRLRTHNKP